MLPLKRRLRFVHHRIGTAVASHQSSVRSASLTRAGTASFRLRSVVMRYVDRSLAPAETILARGAWPTLYWVGAWAALLVLGIIVVGVFMFIGMAVRMSTTDWAVTDRRVIVKRGWLNLKTEEISVGSIETVQLQQSFLGRIFGFGRIQVTGNGDTQLVFPPMKHAIAFRRAIETARAAHSEVHLAPEDRDVIADAAAAPKRVVRERDADVEEVAVQPRRERKRGRSFVGLR